MNPIVRYTLLFMIWFGTVFGFYLHNKPAESIEPVQPTEPSVQIQESEAQNITLNLLRSKASSLESEIEARNQMLRTLEYNIEELEKQNPTHTKKTKSANAKTEPQRTDQAAVTQPIQRGPIRDKLTPSRERPAQIKLPTTKNQPANTGASSTFSASSMKSYLNEAANRARRCGGRGNLQINLTIGNNGRANRVSAVSGNLKGTSAERCIINEFKNQSFPKFQKPSSINIAYNVRI